MGTRIIARGGTLKRRTTAVVPAIRIAAAIRIAHSLSRFLVVQSHRFGRLVPLLVLFHCHHLPSSEGRSRGLVWVAGKASLRTASVERRSGQARRLFSTSFWATQPARDTWLLQAAPRSSRPRHSGVEATSGRRRPGAIPGRPASAHGIAHWPTLFVCTIARRGTPKLSITAIF